MTHHFVRGLRPAPSRALRALALGVGLSLSAATLAGGHRDAPSLTFTPGADISDVYAFRSWVDPGKVVFILNINGGQEPGDAPLYFTFDPSVTHRVHIDTDKDGRADDVIYEVRFDSEIRPAPGDLNFIQPYLGHPDIPLTELQGITALDGPGSEGMTLRQTYTVTEVRHGVPLELFRYRTLVAVPPNVGTNTMPRYEQLAAQGIYTDRATGVRVFAGQRADTFYSDINGIFDTGNLRGFPLLSPEQEANDFAQPFGLNRYTGTNVNSIAIEVPIERVTRDRRSADKTATPFIGVYGSTSTSRPVRDRFELSGERHDRRLNVQLDRMANPMISLLLMDTPVKDKWVRSRPEDDAQFEFYFTHPSPTRFPTTPYVFKIPSPPFPRLDLMPILLKYPGQPLAGQHCGRPCADLLRLNVRVPPTAPSAQKRMGALLGGDPAGLPNGRRPNDDATDFGLRVVGGPVPRELRLSDGVNFANDMPGAGTADGVGYGSLPGNHLDVTANGIAAEFPFMPTPHSGHAHAHNP
jgi:hypothetical protein